jgi:hypothetical protein
MTTTRAEQYHAATLAAIEASKRLHYNPTDWIVMVRRYGAVEATKRVLRPGPPPSGFVRLAWDMNPRHPELTAEHAALYDFPDLFTEDEKEVARQRLES